mmetsp:Transcript_64881/g.154937  ORF Transcript_64881/g.154937 Transcript_64881/m.154937 type:complete len:219 (-) Transcript_64881:2076-2732(-)
MSVIGLCLARWRRQLRAECVHQQPCQRPTSARCHLVRFSEVLLGELYTATSVEEQAAEAVSNAPAQPWRHAFLDICLVFSKTWHSGGGICPWRSQPRPSHRRGVLQDSACNCFEELIGCFWQTIILVTLQQCICEKLQARLNHSFCSRQASACACCWKLQHAEKEKPMSLHFVISSNRCMKSNASNCQCSCLQPHHWHVLPHLRLRLISHGAHRLQPL